MTDQAEIERAGILQEVLTFVGSPRTVEEVAFEFGWHDQTARNFLWTLRDSGKVRTLARKQSRKKLWQAIGGVTVTGMVNIRTSVGTFPLNQFRDWVDSRVSYTNVLNGCIAYLWRRSYYRSQDLENVQISSKLGTLRTEPDVRAMMAEVHKTITAVKEVLEALLVDYPEFWQEGTMAARMVGSDIDLVEMEKTAAEFEDWYISQSQASEDADLA